MSTEARTNVVWSPQAGPQKAFIDCPLPEIFFGGARGGGKTDGVLGKYALKAERYGSGFNAVFFRKELPMLDDAIERSKELYVPLGATWNEQKKTWRFKEGGRLRFRPLENAEDAGKYQGQNVSDACVEEAGLYPDPAPIDRLNGVLRSAKGVPTQLILTGNPGGAGQQWIKGRYIDPAPLGMQVQYRKLPNGDEHRFVFIPSKVQDNRALLEHDPTYISRLYLVGSPELVRAWLEGDWNAIEGAYFPEFGTKHIVEPFPIPKWWLRFRGMDWGSFRPFSVGWYAVSDGTPFATSTGDRRLPSGAVVRYREYYGCREKEPNIGLKLTPGEVGAEIARRSAGETYSYSVLDPSCYAKPMGLRGPSVAEELAKTGVVFKKADNDRINGWNQCRQRLVGDEEPMFYVFATCVHFIRTIPALQHDELHAEDLDTEGEDHISDEWRYGMMSRPYTRQKPLDKKPILGMQTMTFDQLRKKEKEHRERVGY